MFTGDHGPLASSGVFQSQYKGLFSVQSYCNCDLNCLLPVNRLCLMDTSGACAIISYGSLNKHEKHCLNHI